MRHLLMGPLMAWLGRLSYPRLFVVTAALFLRRFVPDKISWAHLDTYAWRDRPKSGRPKGGEALGLRAIFTMLQTRFADR